MYFYTGTGRITLRVTLKDAKIGAHQGQCDGDIEWLRLNRPKIWRQLAKIDKDILRAELDEYGAWDDEELADHEANLTRILWIACGDIVEEYNQKQR